MIHHLVVDGVSWRILLADLETTYRQAVRGDQLLLPRKTTSFQLWAERLAAYAKSEAVLRQLPFWRSLPAATPLPCDFAWRSEHRGRNADDQRDAGPGGDTGITQRRSHGVSHRDQRPAAFGLWCRRLPPGQDKRPCASIWKDTGGKTSSPVWICRAQLAGSRRCSPSS